MKRLIIAGGGKFGKNAVNFAKKNDYKTILIDNNPKCFASKHMNNKFESLKDLNLKIEEIKPGEIYFLIQDISIAYELITKFNPEYVIPVVPIHLIAMIIKTFLLANSINLNPNVNLTRNFIKKANKDLLLSYNVEEGVAYLSYAKYDEICPENCPGPPNYCPNFKRVKPITITEYFKKFYNVSSVIKIGIDKPCKIININESYQLMPGLGGLRGKDIKNILGKLKNNLNLFLNQKCSFITATACNCHGVINFYKIKEF
ncbi:MAG: hypothetical protein ACTSRI_02410 [Promethearchaeota archaeon]